LDHIYVLVGTGFAVVITVLCFAPPKYWKTPSKCRLPADIRELGPFFFILVGANAVTAAIRLGGLLVLDRVDIRSGAIVPYKYASPTDEDFLYFLAGALGALFVGLITTRDGVTRLRVESRSPGGSRPLRRAKDHARS
jgi:hypothetical protein